MTSHVLMLTSWLRWVHLSVEPEASDTQITLRFGGQKDLDEGLSLRWRYILCARCISTSNPVLNPEMRRIQMSSLPQLDICYE